MTLRLRSCLASAGGIPSQIGSIPDPPSAAAVAATVAHLIDVPLSTLPCPFNTAVFTSQTIRSPMTTLMKACLSKSVGLIANVSADSIQLKEYSEDYSNNLGAILDEYRISGTMTICESNQGQALLALNASIQGKTYDKALSKCLGTNVSLVAASFTPLRADKPSWSFTPRPTHTATPRPTLFTEHDSYGPFSMALAPIVALMCLLCVYGLRRSWCHNSEGRMRCRSVRPPFVNDPNPRVHRERSCRQALEDCCFNLLFRCWMPFFLIIVAVFTYLMISYYVILWCVIFAGYLVALLFHLVSCGYLFRFVEFHYCSCCLWLGCTADYGGADGTGYPNGMTGLQGLFCLLCIIGNGVVLRDGEIIHGGGRGGGGIHGGGGGGGGDGGGGGCGGGGC